MRNYIAFVIALLVLPLLMASCTKKKSEECPIKTLILDENLFPQGTQAEELFSPVPDEPINSAERTFYYAPDSALQEVIQWNSVRAAKRYFDFRAKSVFDVDKYMGPWTTPSELNYISPSADKYRVACGVAHGVYQCRMIATYDEYFVFFRSYVTEQGISLSTFDQLLKAIDVKMTQCTGK
jgi:hypothetical protein